MSTQAPIIRALPNGFIGLPPLVVGVRQNEADSTYPDNGLHSAGQGGSAESQALQALQFRAQVEDEWEQGIDMSLGRAMQVMDEFDKAVRLFIEQQMEKE